MGQSRVSLPAEGSGHRRGAIPPIGPPDAMAPGMARRQVGHVSAPFGHSDGTPVERIQYRILCHLSLNKFPAGRANGVEGALKEAREEYSPPQRRRHRPGGGHRPPRS